MAKKFSELTQTMPPESVARAEKKAQDMLEEIRLADLREARGMTQEELARRLNIRQASVSKMEKRTDMYISTLSSHIRAMGGELEVVARFPDGSVRISNFSELGRGEPRPQ